MEKELNKVISEEQRDQLIVRINELYDNGVLKIRDWIAMYDLMLEACERDSIATYEQIVEASINSEGDER